MYPISVVFSAPFFRSIINRLNNKCIDLIDNNKNVAAFFNCWFHDMKEIWNKLTSRFLRLI